MDDQKPQRSRLYTEMFGDREIVTEANFSYLAYNFANAALARREKLAQFLKTLEHDIREIIATTGFLKSGEMQALEVNFHRETRGHPLTLVLSAEEADLRYNNLPVATANLIDDLRRTAQEMEYDNYLVPEFCSIGHRHIIQVNSPWALILLFEDYIEKRTPYITIDAIAPAYEPRYQDSAAKPFNLMNEFAFRMLGERNDKTKGTVNAHARSVEYGDQSLMLPVSFIRLRCLLDSISGKTMFDTSEPESHTYVLQ